MRNAQIEIADIAGQLDSLRQGLELQLDELRAKQADLAEQLRSVQRSITALETRKPAPAPVAPNQPIANEPVKEGIPEEILLVISAAVAAFLGKSARVRSARYLHEGLSPWAQQGRVYVQASHNLAHHE
jgi:methylmalonyl-CoA carboxyltransferase large subunit